MAATGLTAEADALRHDLGVMIEAASGYSIASSGSTQGCEMAVSSFADRARRLQQAFAAARLRLVVADADKRATGTDLDALRNEVVALEQELHGKDALIAMHHQHLQQWKAECDSIAQEARSLSSVQRTAPPKQPSPGASNATCAASPSMAQELSERDDVDLFTGRDAVSASEAEQDDEDMDEEFDEFD